jgi:arylsulfatase
MILLVAGCSSGDDKSASGQHPKPAADKRPNILLLVLDDVGEAEMAPFGGEIPVPVMDSLAKTGVKFTDFHASPSCSPTRSMLYTGVDNHQAGLGNMAETLLPQQKGNPGYEGVLNNRVVTVAELLRDNGYHTYMTGKWHLGAGDEDPHNRGFEETFVLLEGMGGHFEPQVAYEGASNTYTRNGKVVDAPKDVFDAGNDTNQLIKFIDAHRADGKPFFADWAVRMAHDPLQAPADLIKQFKGRYDAGYDVLRKERVDRMKTMGLIPQNTSDAPSALGNELGGGDAEDRPANGPAESPAEAVKPWDQLSRDEQALQAREMEVYAAMLAEADIQIGRLFDHLRQIGQYDNTEIILLSDNGPNAETIAFYGADQINKRFNNSLGNIGNHDSFAMYGPGWADAGSGPYRLYKGFETEGGTRTPMIISGPGLARHGDTSDVFADVIDITPTILDMAGVKHPDTYSGRPVLPMQGTSMLPFLIGTQQTVHPIDQPIGAEMWGRAALFKGDWKLLWVEPPYGTGQWELHNLKTDVAERLDVSTEQPDKFKEMMADWDKYAKDDGLILALGHGIGG